MTNAKTNLSVTELQLEIPHERINPDAFDRLFVAMLGIEIAAARSRQCSSRLDCGTMLYTRSDSRAVGPRAFTQCVSTLASRVRLRSGFCSCLHCFSAHHALSRAARFLPDYFCRVHSQKLDMAS